MLRRQFFLMAGLAPFAAATAVSGGRASVSRKLRRWLGRETVAVLLGADRVQGYAVEGSPFGPPHRRKDAPTPVLPAGTPATIRGYPVYAVGPVQPEAFGRRLAGLLLDEGSYWAEAPPIGNRMIKGCIPVPGVVFRVWAGRRAIDVLLCFTCDQVLVARSTMESSKDLAKGDIDPSRAAFVALAHEALADVPKVRAIPPIHPRP